MEVSDAKGRLENLAHRIKMLEKRIERQESGSEIDVAKNIISGLKKQYKMLEQNEFMFIPEATSAQRADTCTEEELADKLGNLYWIFGSSFEETFSFKKYRIVFLRTMPYEDLQNACVMRVQVEIYENDQPFVMREAKLDFWSRGNGSHEVNDIGLAWSDLNSKYSNTHWFQKLAYTLAYTWNKYFSNAHIIYKRNVSLLCNPKRICSREFSVEKYGEISDEAMQVIQKYEEANKIEQLAGYNELSVVLSLRSRKVKETLLYALNNGTAYTIQYGKIYIWYKPFQKMEGSRFFKLKRFLFFYGGNMVKFVLDGDEGLSNPL